MVDWRSRSSPWTIPRGLYRICFYLHTWYRRIYMVKSPLFPARPWIKLTNCCRACAIVIGGSVGRKLHRVLLQTVMRYDIFPGYCSTQNKLTVSRAPLSFFSQTETGSILSRFSQDMTLIERQLSDGLLITATSKLVKVSQWKPSNSI